MPYILPRVHLKYLQCFPIFCLFSTHIYSVYVVSLCIIASNIYSYFLCSFQFIIHNFEFNICVVFTPLSNFLLHFFTCDSFWFICNHNTELFLLRLMFYYFFCVIRFSSFPPITIYINILVYINLSPHLLYCLLIFSAYTLHLHDLSW